MDYKDKKERFEDIMKGIGEDLKPIFDRMVQKSNKSIQDRNIVDYTEYVPPCGITERNTPLTEEQIKEAEQMVQEGISSILDAEDEYADFTPQIPPKDKRAGTGSGDKSQRVRIVPMEFPEWLEEVESELIGYFEKKKGRKGLDYEELIKGRIAKAKTKIVQPESALYVLLDTSGSMWWELDSYGRPLIQVFGSYFPEIAKKYSGEVWQTDYAPLNDKKPIKKRTLLSDFRSYDLEGITEISVRGGSGTDFYGVFQYFDKMVRELQEKKEDARVLLLVLTDMGVSLSKHPELIEGKDIIFVTNDMPSENHDVMKFVNGENIRLIAVNKKKK